MFKGLIQKTIMQRTGYKAKDGDKIIDGCGQCSHNATIPGFIMIAPGHVCDITLDNGCQHKTILDPFNIPKWCPIKIEEVSVQ